MSLAALSTDHLLLIGGGALIVGVVLLVYLMVSDPEGPVGRAWLRYLSKIEVELNRLASKNRAIEVVAYQALAIVALVAITIVTEIMFFALLAVVVVPLTFIGFWFQYEQRRTQIGQQLDAWLLMLSNMLQAVGSVGAAIRATADLAPKPLSEEVDILLKHVDVGTPLEDALDLMYQRVPTPGLRTVVTSLRVGRRMGGELPGLLAENAKALREAERIEGYIRSQIAQGKTQIGILALAPIGLIYMFHRVEPDFFSPLLTHSIGPWVIAGAGLLWAAALYVGFKIVQLDV